MRLRKFHVSGFRCIRDSGVVPVGDLAALIGKNENGKTALLQALLHLNKEKPVSDLDRCDEMWEVFQAQPKFRIVEGIFELAEAETKAVAENVAGAPEIKILHMYRTLENNLEYDFGELVFDNRFELNKEVNKTFQAVVLAVKSLISTPAVETDPASVDASSPIPLPAIEGLTAPDKLGKEQTMNAIEELSNASKSVPQLADYAKNIQGLSEKLFDTISIRDEVEEYILEKLHPRLVYFSDYKTIYGAIKIPQYLSASGSPQDERLDTGERLDKRETIDNLFFLACLDPKRLEEIKKSPALKNKYLSECSDRLTKALRPTWLSQPIDIELVYDTGDVLWVKVSDVHEDGSRTNKGPLSRRAAGFIWHFSFFVNFTAETQRADLKDAVILLDEPGLHLHPAQQTGTLEVLKRLAKRNQIIYTTHSPFMIFDYTVGNLLTVELDRTTHLSTIRSTYWDNDSDTLIPILHALGAPEAFGDASKSITKRPVAVVEGITDYQYLTTIWDLLATKKADVAKSFANVELVQANGSAAIAPLALYHRRRGKIVVTLFDNEPGAHKLAEGLISYGFPEDKIVFCIVDSKAECDIEDLFAEKEYLDVVNQLYQDILKDARFSPLTSAELKAKKQGATSLVRVVPILESIWEDHKNQNWGTFDKKKVCEKMCEKIYTEPKFLGEKTIDRFSQLLKNISEAIHPVPSEQAQSEVPVSHKLKTQ